jgi:hypothetical protein
VNPAFWVLAMFLTAALILGSNDDDDNDDY